MKVRLTIGSAVVVAEAIAGTVAVTVTGEPSRVKLGQELTPEDRAALDAALSGTASVLLSPGDVAILADTLGELANIATAQAHFDELAGDFHAVARLLPRELAARLEGGRDA